MLLLVSADCIVTNQVSDLGCIGKLVYKARQRVCYVMARHEEVIRAFCEEFAWKVDTAVLDYLTSVIQDVEDSNGVGLNELAELLSGYSPSFSNLTEEEQHDRLCQLFEKVPICLLLQSACS